MQRNTSDHDATAAEGDLLTRMRELVLGGSYEPGMALSEVRLAEHFDVSRTPIREALKQLQVEGLVEIRPKVGTFVRQVSRREIVELFELKEVLEGMAARLLAQRGRTEELLVLEANVTSSEDAAARRDSETYAGLVKEFHETLVHGADNQKLTQHYRTLMNQLAYHRFVRSTVEHPGRLRQSVAEHRAVLELIQQKDGIGAEIAMRRHVGSAAYEVLSDPPPSH
ncbi:GntR family transcriptional regulator [Flexivirga oryzae]|uniref:DNA-binding GntR family transcriptional regulator n=1 Tax=Flexivirga oryzae TaxID=1794944 RepID=A0A839NGW4_9MICO|nr:GntR family transcriptional regulator [Flexivirga oryzae]MBB2893911.1 DNA-binding GntR family transcriptional regulator [Flexivirga oryzae]